MTKQIIQIPDTLEVKEIKDGKIILVEKKKKLTYEDIVIKLKPIINVASLSTGLKFYATSSKMFDKIHAIDKLMIVAKYLNGDWQPDWSDNAEAKWFVYSSNEGKEIKVDCFRTTQHPFIYFKSKNLAEKAIEILGEETIKLAFCTDY